MNRVDECLTRLQGTNTRITKARKAMLQALDRKHLSFKTLQKELARQGFTNVATIYNNLNFFVEQKIVIEVPIRGIKYYTLTQANPLKFSESHIHLVNNTTNTISELEADDIYNFIENHPSVANYNLEYVTLTIVVKEK